MKYLFWAFVVLAALYVGLLLFLRWATQDIDQ